MRRELIEKLFEELEKDKETIKRNLIEASDSIGLSLMNEYEKVILTIKIQCREDLDK